MGYSAFMLRRSTLIFLLVIAVFSLVGQESMVYKNAYNNYEKGLELFDKGKFVASQNNFKKAFRDIGDPNSEISANVEYYIALCALELFNKDAEILLRAFIENHPHSPKIKIVYFQLGRYSYRKKKWDKVLDWFSKVDIYDLTDDERSEYYFKTGYSNFMLKDYDNAGKMFYEIKDLETKFTAPARYYYSHIAYHDKNYQTALEGLRKLQNHEKFDRIVPYYITQILYLQKKYDELINYAPALLDSGNPKRAPEIAKLIGESYYCKDNFKAAIPYLENYMSHTNSLNSDDKYEIGYAYYKNKEYKKAIGIFKRLSGSNDELAQTAFYHMGDCYLKTNKKRKARNAFKSSYDLDFDQKIKEDALYNYALLSYDSSFDPYNTAVKSFQKYIQDYPNSARRDEAFAYLLDVYLSTKNYSAALKSLDSMSDLSPKMQGAYQHMAFNSAVELFHDRKLVQSIKLFEKSRKYPAEKNLTALTYYWIGEAHYKKGRYALAAKNYLDFVFEPGAILLQEFDVVNYNLGYAFFKTEDYKSAIKSFRKFISKPAGIQARKLADANLRIADSYFMKTEYDNAGEYYHKVVDINVLDVDYALYQKAMVMGLLAKRDEKIKTLQQLVNNYKSSDYLVDGKFQLAKSYVITNKENDALKLYDDIVMNHPTSSYVKRSLLNQGLILYNKNENEKALDIFKKITANYPTYDDSKEALASIKSIYIKLGKVDDYANYMSGLSFVNVSTAAYDSATYEAAELRYMNKDVEGAREDFEKYLIKFSPAIYGLHANFYKAECEYRLGNYKAALKNYGDIVSRPLNKFTESALVKASSLNYNEHLFEDALANYIMLEKVAEYKSYRLEARAGQMRCFYFTKQFNSSIDYAMLVLGSDKASENQKVEAHIMIARSAYEMDSLGIAYNEFERTANMTQSEMGAEAKYSMAYIKYKQKDYEACTNQIYGLVNETPSYEYWVAKSFILLADVSIKTSDVLQAKATLQSIIDNYKGESLLKIAKERLAIIIRKEQEDNEINELEEIEIEFDEELEELFEEDDLEPTKLKEKNGI